MRNFTKVLLGVTTVFLIFGAYIIFGPKLAAEVLTVETMPAVERAEAFSALAAGIERGDFSGNQYRPLESKRAEDYVFETITVTVRNYSILRAEWALVNMVPLTGDVVLIAGEPVDIAPFGSAEVTASVLTKRGGEARTVWVDYYLFGYKENAPYTKGDS